MHHYLPHQVSKGGILGSGGLRSDGVGLREQPLAAAKGRLHAGLG